MSDQDTHLNEDQMIRAVVDEDDLTIADRNHLVQCARCQEEKQKCEQLLHRLGDMSKELIPLPQRRFTPVVQGSYRLVRWHTALASGFAIALLMIAIWWTLPFTRFHQNGSVHIAQEMKVDQQVMTDITSIEDDALPARYLDIVGSSNGSDNDEYYSDEFLEFVLPL